MSSQKNIYRSWYQRESNHGLSLWLSPRWLDMSCGSDQWDVTLSRDSRSEIDGALVFHRYRRGPFSILANPPHTPSVGPWIKPSLKRRRSTSAAHQDRVMSQLIAELPSASYTRLALSSGEENISQWVWSDFFVGVKQTMILELSAGLEDIKQNSTSKLAHIWTERHEIETLDWETYKNFHQRINQQRKSARIQWADDSHMPQITEIDGVDLRCTAIYDGEEIVSAICLIRDWDRCYYIHGATSKSHNMIDANACLLAEGIQWAIERNCKIFDFEGTTLPGVYEFFRKFGARISHNQFVERKSSRLFSMLRQFKA